MNATPQVMPSGLLNDKKVSVWRAILSAVCYFIFYFAIQLVVEIGYTIYFYATLPGDGLSEEAVNELWNQAIFDDGNYLMIIMDVLIFLVLAIIFLVRGKTFAEGMGMKKTKFSSILLAFLAGLGLTCVLSFVMIFVSMLFPGLMEDYSNTMDTTYNMKSLIPYIVAGVIGAPLIEELVFRHLVTGRLSRGIPRVLAIIIGSVLFGVVHGHPVQWVYAGLLGFVMACVYFAYDSIWVPIAMHAGFNALSVVSYLTMIPMNEAQELLFGAMLFLAEMAFALFGTVALIFLLIRRPYKVFKKVVPQEQSAPVAAPTVALVASLYHQYDIKTPTSSIPTVATFSANIPSVATMSLPNNTPAASVAPTESAEPTLGEAIAPVEPVSPVEPIAPIEPIDPVETSSVDEAGGNL